MVFWKNLINEFCFHKQVLYLYYFHQAFIPPKRPRFGHYHHNVHPIGTEISPTASVEEVDNQLKKHEAFEKLLLTQDDRLTTLNTHGDKLLQQNHVESQRIADELQVVNERRKKVCI